MKYPTTTILIAKCLGFTWATTSFNAKAKSEASALSAVSAMPLASVVAGGSAVVALPVLRTGAMTRLGGRMGAANIAFDDHPSAQRYSDQIATVTVDSVFDWMTRAGLTTQPVWYKRDHSN